MKQKSYSTKILLSILLLLFVFTSGAACTMGLQRMCAGEAERIKSSEATLKKLKRENDFWNAQIAISRDPATLRRRAADKFKLPESNRVVFAYQIHEGSSDGLQRPVYAFKARNSSDNIRTAKR